MAKAHADARRGFLAAVLIAVAATAAPQLPSEARAGARQSDVFYNCDRSGTAVAKDVGGGVEWSVQNVFFGNRVFGTERGADGSYTGLTCEVAARTPESVGLACRSFDPVAGACGAAVSAEVPAEFLYGGFPNPANSLFEVTNTYLFFLRTDGETRSFAARFLTADFTASGQPFLVGETAPATVAFLARGIDLPGGTTSRHNFLIGLQTEDRCYDLHVTPTPEHVLVGTFDVAERAGAGCGRKTSTGSPVALIPTAAAGSTFCGYEVKSSGACTSGTLSAGTRVCLPCDGTCSAFAGKIEILFDVDGSSYGRCQDVEVDVVSGATCSSACSDVKAIAAG